MGIAAVGAAICAGGRANGKDGMPCGAAVSPGRTAMKSL